MIKTIGKASCRAAWLIVILALAGCGIGKITGVAVTGGTTCTGNVCGAAVVDPVTIEVRGEGLCDEFKLSLGNGSFPLPTNNVDFGKGPVVFPSLYFNLGWPGPKTITAEGVTNCAGKATTLHRVFSQPGSFREDWQVAIAQPTLQCYEVPRSGPPFPPLRKNTRVSITAATSPKVNFGCTFGCIYDPDGKPGSAAPASFPYPGFREYSLILRVGNQTEQGGTSANFVTNQSGKLLICLNDDLTYDNSGGWQVNITIDESQAE